MKPLIIFLLLIPLVYAAQCDGCEYNGRCVKVGTQVLTSEYGETVYCSSDRKIEQSREDGDACIFDYECRGFFCDNECKTIEPRQGFNFVYFLYGLIIFLMILIIFSLIRSFKYKKQNKPIKTEKKPVKLVLGAVKKKKYKSYDTLESNIDYSMERLSNIFRRKK